MLTMRTALIIGLQTRAQNNESPFCPGKTGSFWVQVSPPGSTGIRTRNTIRINWVHIWFCCELPEIRQRSKSFKYVTHIRIAQTIIIIIFARAPAHLQGKQRPGRRHSRLAMHATRSHAVAFRLYASSARPERKLSGEPHFMHGRGMYGVTHLT